MGSERSALTPSGPQGGAGEAGFEPAAAPTPSPEGETASPRPRWFSPSEAAWKRMISAGLAVSVILTGSILASGGTPLKLDYVALYVTDLPGDFTKLEVNFESVRVGQGGSELVVHVHTVDLAAHVGPSQSILVAEGWIPAGDQSKFDLQFSAARGLQEDEWVDLSLETPWLRVDHDLSRPASGRGAFLLDFSLQDSIVPVVAESGEASSYRFVPVVARVYVQDVSQALASAGAAAEGPRLTSAPEFSEEDSEEPLAQLASDEAPDAASGEADRPWYEDEAEGDYVVVQPQGGSLGAQDADDEPQPDAGDDEPTTSPSPRLKNDASPTTSPPTTTPSPTTTPPIPTATRVAVNPVMPPTTTPTAAPTTSPTPTLPTIPTPTLGIST